MGIAIASNNDENQEKDVVAGSTTTIGTTTNSSTTADSEFILSLSPLSSSTPTNSTNIFLFFTEAEKSTSSTSKDVTSVGNRVYKYELVDNTKLANPTLLLDLSATTDDSHIGGALQIGHDNNLYITLGDQRPTAFARTDDPDSQTKAQNYIDGKEPDGRVVYWESFKMVKE